MRFCRDIRVVSFLSTMLLYYITFYNIRASDRCPNFDSISFNELGFVIMNQCLYSWSYWMHNTVGYHEAAMFYRLNVVCSSVSYAAIAAFDQQYNGKYDFYRSEHFTMSLNHGLLACVVCAGISIYNNREMLLLSRNNPIVPKNSGDDKTKELHEYYLRNSSAKFPYRLLVESGSFKNVVVNGVEEEALFLGDVKYDYPVGEFVKSLLKRAHSKRDWNARGSRSFSIEE